jgi:hypothetical protein
MTTTPRATLHATGLALTLTSLLLVPATSNARPSSMEAAHTHRHAASPAKVAPRRVTVARAQANALRAARDAYLGDGRAFAFGTGLDRTCTRRSRSSVKCSGWIDTYMGGDLLKIEPETCWFDLLTAGTKHGFRLTTVTGSAHCEPLGV